MADLPARKLTEDLRRTIRHTLLQRFQEPRKKAVELQEGAVAMQALRSFLGDAGYELYGQVPQGWLNAGDTISWQYFGHRRTACFLQEVPLPAVLSYGNHELRDKSLESAYMNWRSAEGRLEADIDQLRNKINAALYAVTTVHKLVAMWPEVVEVLPQTARVIKLPAPRVDEINRLLGLGQPAETGKTA